MQDKIYLGIKQFLKIAYGYGIYCYIHLLFPHRSILIYDYSGIGDAYVLCMYLKANKCNAAIAVTKQSVCRIFDLFRLKNRVLLTERQAQCLTVLSLAAPAGIELRNITPFPRFNHTDISFKFGGVFLNMAEMYKYQMLKLPEKAGFQYPELQVNALEIDTFIEQNGILPGKSVILSPIAKTIIGFSGNFWEQLVIELKQRGYLVFTNVAGTEKPVDGTKPLAFSFEMAHEVLKSAGLFIALRSGICDVVCNAECKKIILYPDYRIFNSSMYDFCSFQKMGIGRDIIEIQESFENEDKLLQNILEEINE